MSDGFDGHFVWYQLNTNDPEAAGGFYPDVLGWGTEVLETADGRYPTFTLGEQPFGGMMRLPEDAVAAGAQPHWLGYVASSDIDATAEQVQELGGTIMVPPTDIPDVGRFTVFADPQGAILAAYKSATGEPEPPSDPRPGEVGWHELATTDYEAASEFYAELLGWETMEDLDMGEAGVYRIYGKDGHRLGGVYDKPEEMPTMFLYYVTVDDLEDTLGKLERANGSIFFGPEEVPGGRIAQCTDPQGALFALHEVVSEA